MKKVIVASQNPVKINVAKRAFSAVFPTEEFEFVAVKSASGVPEQPLEDETRQGAESRLQFVKEQYPEADFWISQEGGVFRDGKSLCNRAWVMVSDQSGFIGISSTPHFYLPKNIVENIGKGLDLSEAGDLFFSTHNTGQSSGVIGHITEGCIDREEYYLPAAMIALSELKHREWYT
jgi:inosine/xanthosine triphosphatase